ncbi:hypothetical protein UM538_12525 [Staphylococcus aureus]|nr:hypothetical protein UM538_12525 [Staphylococcus aureus]
MANYKMVLTMNLKLNHQTNIVMPIQINNKSMNNAITAAKAILNKQTGPNTAQNAVEAALQRVNTAKDALNGDAKLIAAQNAAKQH